MNENPKDIDKSSWGPGPWQQEPDRVEFRHAGLACLMLRNPSGAWCGYAAVPPGHPLHGRKYDSVDVEVHGGLTYSAPCFGDICHKPDPGEPDDVYWFGFDCCHAGDLAPALEAAYRSIPSFVKRRSEHPLPEQWRDVYRDINYVRRETELLAEQLERF